jgi:hypothetical protein
MLFGADTAEKLVQVMHNAHIALLRGPILLSVKPLERLEPMELLGRNRVTVPIVPNVSTVPCLCIAKDISKPSLSS